MTVTLFALPCTANTRKAPSIHNDHRLIRPALAFAAVTCVLVLSGCASATHSFDTDPALIQEAFRNTDSPLETPDSRTTLDAPVERAASGAYASSRMIIGERTEQSRGRPSNDALGSEALQSRAAQSEGGDDGVVFNFRDQPIEAVINSVMGDLLNENYSIAQGVKGSVSFSTSRPVGHDEALSILETLLSWTDNAMIRQGDRYVILPADQAVAGKLVPEMPLSQPTPGLSARLYPLRYIGAAQMQKLLKPFVKNDAFLLIDPSRNLIGLSGTPSELANYQDTIDTFDVDWLKGMSLGVFGLEHASVAELMPQLQKAFGEESDSPLASMVQFLPNERANSIVAISSQPDYLREVGRWIKTIDAGGGNEPSLHVYDVRNLKASDLAGYLREIFGSQQTASSGDDKAGEVSPGLQSANLSTLSDSDSGLGSTSTLDSGFSDANSNLNTGEVSDAGSGIGDTTKIGTASEMSTSTSSSSSALLQSVRITAQESSNQLLVRARPVQWQEIESAIKRLDQPPRQVQIETRILEVKLTGALDLGVQWYLGQLAGNSSSSSVANASGSQGALGAGGVALGDSSAFYSFVSDNLQVALRALEERGLTQVLSAPSLVVLNNQKAQIQVGDNIPISETTVNTSDSDTTLSSVEYVQTGVILNVVPRINPGGLVYMNIQQQVSDADDTDSDSNPRISTRAVSTQVAVQSGQTVLLGGLIQQNNSESDTRVPGLSSIPGLGWLFGSRSKDRDRTELIVLITPKVVNNPLEAREVTNDYRQQMQLLRARMKTEPSDTTSRN